MVVDEFQGPVIPAHDTGLQFCDAKDRVHSAFFAFLLSSWQSARNLNGGTDEQQNANNKRK
jgi:hypothetical protein